MSHIKLEDMKRFEDFRATEDAFCHSAAMKYRKSRFEIREEINEYGTPLNREFIEYLHDTREF